MKEPIAWMVVNSDGREVFVTSDPMLANVNLGQRALPLYTAPVMDTCADVRSSSPTAGGGFVERELAVTTWADEYLTLINDCEKRSARLTSWELDFIDSLQRQIYDDRGPTPKQIEILDRIWEKATAHK